MPTLERVVNSRVAAPSMVLIPADLASIAVVRAAIKEALEGTGWDGEATQRVVLATSEATANAVEHGSLPGELVEVVYQVSEDEATVRVLDSGGDHPWDHCTDVPAVDPTAPRGRGLTLIHALAKKVEARPAGRGTELRLDFSRAA